MSNSKKNGVKRVKGSARPKNFVTRLQEARYGAYDVGKSTAISQVMDVVLITLHEDMKFSANKNKEFANAFNKNWDYFLDLARHDTPDKTYTKDLLDRRVKAAVPEADFVPYHERYDYDLDPAFDDKEASGVTEDTVPIPMPWEVQE